MPTAKGSVHAFSDWTAKLVGGIFSGNPCGNSRCYFLKMSSRLQGD